MEKTLIVVGQELHNKCDFNCREKKVDDEQAEEERIKATEEHHNYNLEDPELGAGVWDVSGEMAFIPEDILYEYIEQGVNLERNHFARELVLKTLNIENKTRQKPIIEYVTEKKKETEKKCDKNNSNKPTSDNKGFYMVIIVLLSLILSVGAGFVIKK